jgi:NitT/TauT family transport system substrate-binding protein
MNEAPTPWSRRRLLKASGLLAAGMVGGGGLLSACGTDEKAGGNDNSGRGELEPIRLQLNWTVDYGFLGEIVALEKGYYDNAGIKVSILPGGPSIDPNQLLGAGAADVSISSSSSVMMACSAGVPITSIATNAQRHPYTYFSMPSNPIRSPKDFIGKKIGIPNTGLPLLEALLRVNNIERSQVEVVTVGNDFTVLKAGKVDAMTGYNTSLQSQQVLGPDRVELSLADCGVPLYAYLYAARNEFLQKKPKALASLLVASSRGWQWVGENPEEAVDIMVSKYPSLQKKPQLDSTRLLQKLIWNDDTKSDGWGTMSADNWTKQLDIYGSIGQFDGGKKPTLKQVMTMDVLTASPERVKA